MLSNVVWGVLLVRHLMYCAGILDTAVASLVLPTVHDLCIAGKTDSCVLHVLVCLQRGSWGEFLSISTSTKKHLPLRTCFHPHGRGRSVSSRIGSPMFTFGTIPAPVSTRSVGLIIDDPTSSPHIPSNTTKLTPQIQCIPAAQTHTGISANDSSCNVLNFNPHVLLGHQDP